MTTEAEIDPETIPSTKQELGQFIEEAVNITNIMLSPIVPMLDSKYSENLQDLQHQESFVKFQATLSKIKIFVEKVTRLRAFETFFCATNIRKEFFELMKEYEACMNDLNFTMIIIFNEQRRIDNDILTDTLDKIIEVLI
ncbi:hypothetical protein C2G38_2176931 [Gigaspora rosea]|uniref:Uncharacterized protein n=1 Tax=Gigaspora rosea TaxID=44941 RepID=A0A397VHL6_9GLOM|nr:hypothetical protein C2G38_2176931 [Gigaspora rosea]